MQRYREAIALEDVLTPEVSSRGYRMPFSPIRRLAPIAEAAKKRGVHVYHLNIGQPDIETPQPLRDMLAQIEDKVLCYAPSAGTPEFLSWMQEYYGSLGVSLREDQILATTGGSEAIFFAMLACADEGEEVLVVEPFYANYNAFAAMAGLRLVPVTSRGRDGFHVPSPSVWERALTPETRIVLLCNPNNPTGTVYSAEELEQVAEFCRKHDLFLISDEVYREFVYDGRTALSALSLQEYEDLVVVVDSLSKRYSACGIRLGTLVTRNAEVFQACLRMAQARLSAPGVAQMIAVGARDLSSDYIPEVLAEYQRRRDVLFEGLQQIPGVFLRKPEGAFYCIARLPVIDSTDFAGWLLGEFEFEGSTLMISPAEGFYATPGLGLNEVRLAYVLKEEDLRLALRVLSEGLVRYRNERGLDHPELDSLPSEASRLVTP